MSEYNEGDLIEAVKGDTVIRARLRRGHLINVPDGASDLLFHLTLALSGDIRHLEANGYTVTTIEKAFTLPTDSGAVVRIANEGDRWNWLCWRAGNGTWDVIDFRGKSYFGLPDPIAWIREQGETVESVTRLEPVAETAKKVLDALGEYLDGQLSGRTKNDIIKFIGDEFGVTS